MTNNNWEKEFIEKGAALEHDRWAKWQKWMHGRVYDSSKSINPHLKVIPTEDFNLVFNKLPNINCLSGT